MAEAKTKRSDVVATFHRYIGKNPTSDQDWATVRYLMTKAPQEVEARLAKSAEDIKSKETGTAREATTSNIDPVKIAQGLGFTQQDFANDPNFAKYWENRSKAELEEALKKRGDYDASLGRKMTPSEIENRDSLSKIGEEYGLSGNDLEIYNKSVGSADSNKVYTSDEMTKLATQFEKEARLDVADYYKDVEGREMEDLKAGYADIRNEALRYQQQEAKGYKEQLASTKQNLRARGLTFSGRSRGVLGEEGALDAKGVEGEVPQQRRYDWEDTRAGWQEDARDIGTAAERRYGSKKLYEQRDFLNPEGLPDPYGTGTTYSRGGVDPIYLPKKIENGTPQRGYVSEDQADIEKAKERDVQTRKEDRLQTRKYYK